MTKADVLAAADGDGGAAATAPPAVAAGETKPLRGPAAMLAQAMNESRSVPTATSFRTLPVDVLDAKRKALNGVLKERGDEGLVHAPGRLGDRQGGAGVAGDGPLLRGERRQAAGDRARAPSTSGSRSTWSARTARGA